MSTIPASYDVNVLPGVINAGGAALSMGGLMLTQTQRIPFNSGGVPVVQSFQNAAAVSALFGPTSNEYNKALMYFPGFTNATAQPSALLIASYSQAPVAAWLRSAPQSSLITLQGITNGALTITVDGYIHTTSTLNLSSATSFSAAATLIQTAINTPEPTAASVATGNWAIAAGTSAVFTGTISDDVLTVTSVTSGVIEPGGGITGSNVTASTQIVTQLTSTAVGGALGGVGTYAVNIAQAVSSTTITQTFGILTVSTAVASGTLSVGQTITGTGVTAGTVITGYGTGTGLLGTYYVNFSQVAAGTGALTCSATAITVTYDSITGSFVVTSGITGTSSSIAYATGSSAAALSMTAATGAVISQGATAETPATFMNNITTVTQNWATFFTAFDPDNGLGNAQKLLFAQWTNSTNDRYGYVCWDPDMTPTLSNAATSSLGYIITQQGLNGTCLINSPTDLNHQAMISGWAASINFNALNGRISFKFKTQSGVIASVTNSQVAANLTANGYNFVGAYATESQQYTYFAEGGVSGAFQWFDSYINQIWMNAALQQAILNFMTQINSVPYNSVGYSMIEAACLTPINAAVSFGSIQPGIPLSSSQAAQINNQAGITVSTTLATRGWYLLIQPASPQVRQARQSPPCLFWYMDGESIHKITLSSLDVQ